MDDKIIQIEVALNFLNTLFAKAVYFSDIENINKLSIMRYEIYYGSNFDYIETVKKIQEIDNILKKYE